MLFHITDPGGTINERYKTHKSCTFRHNMLRPFIDRAFCHSLPDSCGKNQAEQKEGEPDGGENL